MTNMFPNAHAASCLDEVLKTLRGLEKDLDGFEVERLLSGECVEIDSEL